MKYITYGFYYNIKRVFCYVEYLGTPEKLILDNGLTLSSDEFENIY